MSRNLQLNIITVIRNYFRKSTHLCDHDITYCHLLFFLILTIRFQWTLYVNDVSTVILLFLYNDM